MVAQTAFAGGNKLKSCPRLYRDFLMPALHRRFVKSSMAVLCLCYFESVVIGDKSSLWCFFPLGLCALRTLLLFLSSLTISVLRVSQLHVGQRTTPSPIQTFIRSVLELNTYITFGVYYLSAWLFTETYIWSVGTSADLHFTTKPKPYERTRLNERPIYLRCVIFIVASVQAFLHLYYDYSRIELLATNPAADGQAQKAKDLEMPPSLQRVRAKLNVMLQRSLFRSLPTLAIGPILYSLVLREIAWNWTLPFARVFVDIPRSSDMPPIPPFHFFLMLRGVMMSFMMVALWEFTNVAFTAFAVEEPLKNGQPLTHESKNENGSLINGLKSKKELVKSFAFWELLHIALHFPERRKTIFCEIDSTGATGTIWTKIRIACISEIEAVTTRISNFTAPTATAQPVPQPFSPTSPTDTALVRIQSSPLRTDDILAPSPPPKDFSRAWISQKALESAKSLGESPSWNPQARQLLKHSAELAAAKTLAPEIRAKISPETLKAPIDTYSSMLLQSVLGQPFRSTFRRRANAIMFGTPIGNAGIVIDAIRVLTRLLICSLQEDTYGKVQADISCIISTFASSIRSIEKFTTSTLEVHPTDMFFNPQHPRAAKEAEEIVEVLSESLKVLIGAFEQYAVELRLSRKALREAKQAAKMGYDSIFD